jgi:hypothetical protein
VRHATNAHRERELKTVHDFAAARSMAAQERKRQERERELACLEAQIVEDFTTGHLFARRKAQAALDQCAAQSASEEKDFVEVASELQTDIAALSEEEAVRTSEIRAADAQVAHLPGAIQRAKAENDRLDAAILEMERQFMLQFKEQEDEWNAAKAVHRAQDAQFTKASSWFTKHLGYWSLRSEFLEVTTYATSMYTTAARLRRESEQCEITEWIRGAVMAMAGNAVVLSSQRQKDKGWAVAKKAVSSKSLPRAGSATPSAASGVPESPGSPKPPPPKNRPSVPREGSVAAAEGDGGTPSVDREGSSASVASRAGEDPAPAAAAAAGPARSDRRAQQASLYDQPSLLGEIGTYAQVGCAMLKYGRSGSPHYRVFYVLTTDAAGPRLCWEDQDSGRRTGSNSSIELRAVQKVYLGQFTDVFKRLPSSESFYCSFSLLYVHKQQMRTLDVCADTEAEFEAWVIAICSATKLSPHFPEKLLNVEVMPGASQLLPQDIDFCGTWHIPPQLFVTTRNRLEEIIKRRKGAAVRMTPGDVRFFAQIDIFRACALWRRFRELGLVEPSLPKLYWYLDYQDTGSLSA